MKEIIKEIKCRKKQISNEQLTALVYHLSVGVLSFVFSNAKVLGGLSPFGLAILAGCPNVFTASAATGAFLGYFFSAMKGGAFKYVAALFSILSVKILLSTYRKISNNPLFLSFLAAGASFLTCFFVKTDPLTAFTHCFAETILAAGATFFIFNTAKALSDEHILISAEELASIIIVLNIFLIGLNDMTLKGVSISHILGVFLILTAAKFGGTLAGSLSGITVAFSFLLTGNTSDVTVSYAVCGMLAGVFVSFGKYAQILVVIISTFTAALASDFDLNTASLLIETTLGCALFLTIPRNLRIHLAKIFSVGPKISAPIGIKKSLSMRLDLAANALGDVSDTVEQVSRELSRINSPDINSVLSKIEADTCTGCKYRISCWEKNRNDTVSAVLSMTKAVKSGESLPEDYCDDNFKAFCLRINKMGNCVLKHYSEYAAKISAENRIDEVRGVVTDQFDGISKMFLDLKEDFENDEKFDNTMALTAASALKNLDIRAGESSCRIDKYGRMTLEFKVQKNPDQRYNKMQIMKLLSLVCERNFNPPVLSEAGNDVYITLSERAAYKIDFGVHQLNAYNSNLCGDSYNAFLDAKGHFIIVLSDGMGSGGRAAVDGAMASGIMMRLIKAGFGYDCSLRILNSSMLFKSTDESLATLDIVSIDLFTGLTELYKAGAAPTILRRSGKTGKAESTSLPAGILRDIGFDYANIKMKQGDIVLMMSDGATDGGTDWIKEELKNAQDISAHDLAERICETAKRRRKDPHDDDITVIAAIIEKNI